MLVSPRLYKNLLSLKFETGSYFLKSIKTILHTWAKGLRNSCGLSVSVLLSRVNFQVNTYLVCRFYIM